MRVKFRVEFDVVVPTGYVLHTATVAARLTQQSFIVNKIERLSEQE